MILLLLVATVLGLDILESPEPVLVEQGLPATMQCRTSSPSAVVTWYKDGAILSQEDGRCLLLPDGSLFFLTTVLADSGDYHCAVTARNIMARSASARLSVVTDQEERDSLENKKDTDEEVPTLLKLKPPENISTELLLDGTGVVRWSKVVPSTGYLVLVMAGTVPVSNISVESSVDTVQLHNLSPTLHYSVQLATVYAGARSQLSKTYSLYLSSPLTVASHIPTQLWVIAFLVVIMMTLIIILVITIVVMRSRSMPRRELSSEIEYERSLNQYRPRTQHTFLDLEGEYSDKLYNSEHVYDYATSDQCRFSTKSSDKSSEYGQQYAFTQIHQPLISPSNTNIPQS